MQYTETFIYDTNYDVGTITQLFGKYRCTFECWREYKEEPHITVYLPDIEDFDCCISEEFVHDVIYHGGISYATIEQVYNSERYQYIPNKFKEAMLAKDNVIHCATALMFYVYGI